MTTPWSESLGDAYARAVDYGLELGTERPMLLTPAASRQDLESLNHKWSAFGPFLLADEFSNWYDEALTLRDTAALGDWSPLAKYVVSGPQAFQFSDFLATRDLTTMEVGQVMYTPMVNEAGKLVGDNLVARTSENSFRWTTDTMTLWLEHVREVGNFDVQIDDARPDYCLYSVQGPKSPAILEALTGLSWADVSFSRQVMAEIDGMDVEVVRQGFTGEQGFELNAPVEYGTRLWDAIVTVGGDLGMGFLGNYTSRMTRVEAGLSLLHFDYHPDHDDVPGFQRHAQMDRSEHVVSPFELGLGRFVDLDSGPFIGREALIDELESDSTRWDFVGLVWNRDDVVAAYGALFDEGPSPRPIRFPHVLAPLAVPVLEGSEHVGWATSVSYSPTVRRVISFARVARHLSAVGTELSVRWGSDGGPHVMIGAEVVRLPFVEWKRAYEG